MKSTIGLIIFVIVTLTTSSPGSQTTIPDTARKSGKIIMDNRIDTARQIRDSKYPPDMNKERTPDHHGSRDDDSLRQINHNKDEKTDSIPKQE